MSITDSLRLLFLDEERDNAKALTSLLVEAIDCTEEGRF